MKKNFYVVIRGRETGIFNNWNDCKKQVDGFKGSDFKGFVSGEEANKYWEESKMITMEKTKDAVTSQVDKEAAVNEIFKSLSEQQDTGARKTLEWFGSKGKNYFVFVGYAGTGKTYCINVITESIKVQHDITDGEIEYATFTGKAALVMTQKAEGKYTAITLHKLLYKPEEGPNGQVAFIKKSKHELRHIKLLVVDEASMVSSELLKDMFELMPKCKFLFVGDHGQLPPVGERSWLYDTMRNNPDHALTEIHRQAEGSMIIKLATLARQGGELPLGIFGDIAVLTKDEFYESYADSLLTADQVICGTNKTRKSINAWVRKKLGRTSDLPQDGDKVVCRKNIWEEAVGGYAIVNGMMGTVSKYRRRNNEHSMCVFAPDFIDEKKEIVFATTSILEKSTDFKVFYSQNGQKPIHSIEYGYAITCHRSQGSQWNNVLVINESFPSMPANKYGYNPEFLYTAITRAVKKIIIVIDARKSDRPYSVVSDKKIMKNPMSR